MNFLSIKSSKKLSRDNQKYKYFCHVFSCFFLINFYRSFQDAREFARKQKLKSNPDWRKYCKSGNKPNDIPTNPEKTFKKELMG